MKKITIFALHLGYGGIEKYIYDLCNMLHINYDIEIISTYKSKVAYNFPKNVKILYLINDISNRLEIKESIKEKNFLMLIKNLVKAVKILYLKKANNIRKIKCLETDYIITTRAYHNKLVNKYYKGRAIKIATDHNHHNNNPKYIKELENSVTNFDYFICITKSLYEDYKNIFAPKCVYIPNVINVQEDLSQLNNMNIVSAGRVEHVKGFETAVELAGILKQRKIRFKWNIAGDGSRRNEIQSLINKYNLNKEVTIMGFLNQEKLNELYTRSSLYVCTSYSESFGLTVVEAMSHKLPCLTFDCAKGACEIIENKDLIIENRNIEKMADKIVELLTDKKISNKIGEYNLKKCKEYSPKVVKKEWINLLEGKYE